MGVLFATTTAVVWGGQFVVGKSALESVDAAPLSTIRYAVEQGATAMRTIAPGVVWVAALLASLLALGRLFAWDYADGTLEQLALSPQPLVLLAGAKVLAHWLVTGLPLVVIAPLL